MTAVMTKAGHIKSHNQDTEGKQIDQVLPNLCYKYLDFLYLVMAK